MPDTSFEEEEFTTQFNGRTLTRIGGLMRAHLRVVVGFLIAIAFVSVFDAYFTYLTKRIVDEGILAHSQAALVSILGQYGLMLLGQAVAVFIMVYLTGILGEKVRYELRQKMF